MHFAFGRARGTLIFMIALGTTGFVACGSRTALPFDDTAQLASDASEDVRRLPDGGIEDSLPPIDAMRRDAHRMDCLDARDTQIYAVTSDTNELLAFYPPQGTFKRIGVVSCPAFLGAQPFSMAVDRKGVAYVLFENQTGAGDPDGEIFRVSTTTAACVRTAFRPNDRGFQSFGMGFSTNMGGPAETLFIARNANSGTPTLGSIDTTTMRVTNINDFNPPIASAELTGTGDGRLFAFYARQTGAPDSFVGEIDKTTANVIAEDRIAMPQGNGWAFAFWGGDFYLFTGAGGSSTITKFDPITKATTEVGSYPALIVGAGVSTCAPP